MTASKYATLTRSQIVIGLNQIETRLLGRIKYGSPQWARLQRERLALLHALKQKDAELLQRWETGFLFGKQA